MLASTAAAAAGVVIAVAAAAPAAPAAAVVLDRLLFVTVVMLSTSTSFSVFLGKRIEPRASKRSRCSVTSKHVLSSLEDTRYSYSDFGNFQSQYM